MVSPNTEVPLNNLKDQTTDTHNMYESQKHYVL